LVLVETGEEGRMKNKTIRKLLSIGLSLMLACAALLSSPKTALADNADVVSGPSNATYELNEIPDPLEAVFIFFNEGFGDGIVQYLGIDIYWYYDEDISVPGGTIQVSFDHRSFPGFNVEIPTSYTPATDVEGTGYYWATIGYWVYDNTGDGDEEYYRLSCAPTEITVLAADEPDEGPWVITIPYVKTVEQDGTLAPGTETFNFALQFVAGWPAGVDPATSYAVTDWSVTTNGVGNYNGSIVLTIYDSVLFEAVLDEGIFVWESDDGAADWTYSEAAWFIDVDLTDPNDNTSPIDLTISEIIDWEEDTPVLGRPVSVCSFTNTYTADEPGPWVITIPYVKTVEQGGDIAPGDETFDFLLTFSYPDIEPFGFDEIEPLDDDDPYTATGLSITTTSTGNFTGNIVLTVYDPVLLENIAYGGGLILSEIDGGALNWTYSTAEWFIDVDIENTDDPDSPFVLTITICEITGWDEDEPILGAVADVCSFTNIYTSNYSAPWILTIPYVKTVEQGGDIAPGEQTFDFELYTLVDYPGLEPGAPIPAGSYSVTGLSVATDGVGNYSGLVELTINDPLLLGVVLEGGMLFFENIDDAADDWSYSEAAWLIQVSLENPDDPDTSLVCTIFEALDYVDGQLIISEASSDVCAFTNVYTANLPISTPKTGDSAPAAIGISSTLAAIGALTLIENRRRRKLV